MDLMDHSEPCFREEILGIDTRLVPGNLIALAKPKLLNYLATVGMGFKMSYVLGLRIGGSFAEVCGYAPHSTRGTSLPKPSLLKRWYLPKRGVSEALQETFQHPEVGRSDQGTLFISTSRVEQSLDRHQGQSPAFLVTAGFESWLRLKQPLISPLFSSSPERAWVPIADDQIFGIAERVGGDGNVIIPLKMEELDFLVAKLELLKIKHVAIGFLHSDLHPEHEIQAALFLRERGFHVSASHAFATSATDETDRWRQAVEAAYAESALEEERANIESTLLSILGEKRAGWDVRVWTAAGLSSWSSSTGLIRGGFHRSLLEYAQASGEAVTLHLGLENFCLLTTTTHPSDRRSFEFSSSVTQITPLSIQPTRRIELRSWPVPSFGKDDCGYQPGPMLFGKSHHLAALDILFVQNRLEEIAELTPLVSDRARSRILESLFTLGKTIPSPRGSGTIDAQEVAADLETSLVERIAVALARNPALCNNTGQTSQDRPSHQTVALTGALARSLAPLLHRRRPDLRFKLDPLAEWVEATACPTKAHIEGAEGNTSIEAPRTGRKSP